MQTPFSLDSRLELCAGFVRAGAKLADIGTDHAYLPVALMLKEHISSAIAADINPEPLSRGKQTIDKYDLAHKIQVRLSDGLLAIAPDEVDDIVIAGMGADTIIGIISAAPWLKNRDKHLILQPMTKGERLIKYLYNNGFEIINQKACIADGKPYTVMLASYTGNEEPCDELFTYTGKLHPELYKEDREFLYLQSRILSKRSAADEQNARLSQMIIERIKPYDKD